MTPDPIEHNQRQNGKAVKVSELTRMQGGLVNDIRPPKPQPPKQKVIRQGGSKASKILKGQR